ncbi:MAG: hypothetical protein EOP49_16295, partial [Sphingobacteriales bacterium]
MNTESFLVRESKTLLYVVAGIFALLFAASLFVALRGSETGGIELNALNLAILPAVFCIVKARRTRTVFRIDRQGIFYYGKPVTNWAGFVSAHVGDVPTVGNFGQNFFLYVKYRKPGVEDVFMRSFPLT